MHSFLWVLELLQVFHALPWHIQGCIRVACKWGSIFCILALAMCGLLTPKCHLWRAGATACLLFCFFFSCALFVVMMFLLFCGIHYLLTNRRILHSEIHVGFISKLGTESDKDLACSIFIYNASLHDLNFNWNCVSSSEWFYPPMSERNWLLLGFL